MWENSDQDSTQCQTQFQFNFNQNLPQMNKKKLSHGQIITEIGTLGKKVSQNFSETSLFYKTYLNRQQLLSRATDFICKILDQSLILINQLNCSEQKQFKQDINYFMSNFKKKLKINEFQMNTIDLSQSKCLNCSKKQKLYQKKDHSSTKSQNKVLNSQKQSQIVHQFMEKIYLIISQKLSSFQKQKEEVLDILRINKQLFENNTRILFKRDSKQKKDFETNLFQTKPCQIKKLKQQIKANSNKSQQLQNAILLLAKQNEQNKLNLLQSLSLNKMRKEQIFLMQAIQQKFEKELNLFIRQQRNCVECANCKRQLQNLKQILLSNDKLTFEHIRSCKWNKPNQL